MRGIFDTLYADPKEVAILVKKYRQCQVSAQNSYLDNQRFLVSIPDEIEERYFDFLLENDLAMSSMMFLRRINGDQAFAQRMVSRLTAVPPGAREATDGAQCEET